MIKALEDYLERRGAKYFVTLLMFCYVLGTLIFTIYLGNLGVSDFEFLQLRYMFAGIIFSITTVCLFLPIYLFIRHTLKPKSEKFYEILFALGLLFWAPIYALKVFPEIPSNLGGAKPVIARFIGDTERIKEINQIIENETGATNLPLEIFPENSNLAKGANVKILDRNKDRIWLILTKDLYFSSKSNLAKVLTEAGESLDDLDSDTFSSKPLFVETSGIKNISFTLYEPSENLTTEDLNILKSSPKFSKKSTEVVRDFITQKSPEKAETIIKALEEKDASGISEFIDASFDSTFITFREVFFQKGIELFDRERSRGILEGARQELVLNLLEAIRIDFPENEVSLKDFPYLTKGASEVSYPQKIARALQGAPDIGTFLLRLKRLKVEENFEEDAIEVGAEENKKEESDMAEDKDNLPLQTGSGSVLE